MRSARPNKVNPERAFITYCEPILPAKTLPETLLVKHNNYASRDPRNENPKEGDLGH